MLQVKNIYKEFITGDLKQVALDNVSLNLRDNEFVAVLGPSGSGKTTLLNIIGGLDRYDDGDLIINGISTKRYKDRDWDSYRNHTIGFVFQSYNLIPHQSILSNVELALTISGVGKTERRKRAKRALETVGLLDQCHKKPNQMSGGQMQRVAIARALVNNPKILLADEPTGALDSETSIQVMELLKEVAKDRLVVMVTHNPELAETYANRIVKLRDGKIISDTNPFEVAEKEEKPITKNMGKSSMSIFTSLSLSFNNLKTKFARTILTSFAGSIGIIGIALILALSTGVNAYIEDIQKSTMTSYPITIEEKTIDLSAVMEQGSKKTVDRVLEHELDGIYANTTDFEMASTFTTSITENNLTKFKKYLDDKNSEIHKFVGENGIVYSYKTNFGIYTLDPKGEFVNTDGSTLESRKDTDGMFSMAGMEEMKNNMLSNFTELLPGENGKGISNAVKESYDILYGNWPQKYNEIVLVVDKYNEIPSSTLYQLGILPSAEYKDMLEKIEKGESVEPKHYSFKYSDICDKDFYMIPASDTYEKLKNGNFKSFSDDEDRMKELMEKALNLKVVGVIRPQEDAKAAVISSAFAYTKELSDYISDKANNSEIVKEQAKNTKINVLNGLKFSPEDDKEKIRDAKKYLTDLGVTEKAKMCKVFISSSASPEMAAQVANMSETELAAMLDNYLKNPKDEVLLGIYDTYISSGTFDENMTNFGAVNYDVPSAISIYTDSFENKDMVASCIEEYNLSAEEKDKISYTDYVGILMSSITTIIDVISYVLIAFVAVSLIVSSIMIGIITYISVLERTKEIGILRAIGASKRNISQVFNAETFIIGLCSGVLGILISELVIIPANAVIHSLTGVTNINAQIPPLAAVILVVLSVILTLIGGLIPAKKAAKKDPVTALRTE